MKRGILVPGRVILAVGVPWRGHGHRHTFRLPNSCFTTARQERYVWLAQLRCET
jgi:hypothetical protein